MGAIVAAVGLGVVRMVRTAVSGFGAGAEVAGWLVGAELIERGDGMSGCELVFDADIEGEPGCEAARSSSSSVAKADLRLPRGRAWVMTAVSAMLVDVLGCV